MLDVLKRRENTELLQRLLLRVEVTSESTGLLIYFAWGWLGLGFGVAGCFTYMGFLGLNPPRGCFPYSHIHAKVQAPKSNSSYPKPYKPQSLAIAPGP